MRIWKSQLRALGNGAARLRMWRNAYTAPRLYWISDVNGMLLARPLLRIRKW